MTRHLEVRPGAYHDSVTLMQVSQTVAAEAGVVSALVAMATPLNLELLAGMGFEQPPDAGPNDLVVGIDAVDDDAVARALTRAEAGLTARSRPSASDSAAAPPPRTIGSAARRADTTVAFVSTPGSAAFVEAMDALQSGLPVIVFSDNVPIRRELQLKQEAARRGLLVLGPDCGTTVISGVGFGFANVVHPGPIGLVAASGTGAQQVMSLAHAAGAGISHCIGVGGRDLSAEIGGLSTLAALDLLAADETTQVIAVVSKPPAPEVADALHARAATLGKPVIFGLLGTGTPDLTSTAQAVVSAAGARWHAPRRWPAPAVHPAGNGHIRGLFAGGTLCNEAMLIVAAARGPVSSNIPLRPEWALPQGLRANGDTMIDFGDDELTRGRPHPMIDNSLRIERMMTEADDPQCAVLVLDVVLGHGAHPDPAADLAPAVTRARNRAGARGRDLAVIVALIGTSDDPQGLERQAAALHDAGASVHLSNADAARHAVQLTGVTV